MIFVTLNPFSHLRASLLIPGIFGLLSSSSFADSIFREVSSTPYDSQMTRIRPVLESSRPETGSHPVSLSIVNHWIEDLRGIPYRFSNVWRTPAEVNSDALADCKGKAISLYERMRARGADSVRLVIGKRTSLSRITHAWLTWETSGGTYILDPTIKWAACPIERLDQGAYVPLYGYAGTQKFRAATTLLLAKN